MLGTTCFEGSGIVAFDIRGSHVFTWDGSRLGRFLLYFELSPRWVVARRGAVT